MAKASKMMSGSPILQGDNTIPGLKIHKEVLAQIPDIEAACKRMGLDYYPIIVEFVRYDEMAELASYGGFPVRYPHWKWGMEYEELSRGYEYNQYRISEMVINCLHPETSVITGRGTTWANDVKVNDVVYGGDGTPRKVIAVEKQPRKSTTKIRVRGFGRDIICSHNHKWRVMSDKGLVWKEAKDIKSNDILVGADTFSSFVAKPARIEWSKDEVVASTRIHNRKFLKEISPNDTITLELAELLGAVVGDGSTGVVSRENAISVVVDKKLPEYQRHIEDLFLSVFKTEAMVEECRDSVNVVTFCSKLAVDFFNHIGVLKGSTFETKRVPWSIWASSHEYRAAFLRGLFDTDGSSSGVISFSAYNHELVCDVQLLLLEMGIASNCFRTDNGKNEISVIRVQGKNSVKKFHSRIGFSLDYKNEWLEELVNVGNSTNRGVQLPYIQEKIIELARIANITSYNEPSLGRSINLFKKKIVGSNVLIGFMDRLTERTDLTHGSSTGYDLFVEVLQLLSVPYFEVNEVCEWEECETIDIALDHEDHDFIAAGLVTHNTNPCYIYCMDSNTLVDNVDVIAHAIGHNDFFKNNIFFEPTDENMMNKLANHGTRIRKYMARWGYEVVTEFIDHVLRVETLIDPQHAWKKKKIKNAVVKDERNYRFPERLTSHHNYMDEWVNTKEFIQKQNDQIEKDEAAEFLDIFGKPEKDIMGYLKDNAPLKPWQQDIISMLYEESIYFQPQRQTKMLNEGWASYVDYHLMCREGMASLGQKRGDDGIWAYADHKWRVLGGKYSMNPYKMGFELLLDIEERWDKGRFGKEYNECADIVEKEKWNKKLGLGKEKVFEVRKYYNDYTAIQEFFTPELCEKKQFFEWRLFPGGEYKIVNRDFKSIKAKLLKRYLNGGLPDIRLTDPNHLGKGWFFIKHMWDGRPLEEKFARETIISLHKLWQNVIVLSTQNMDDEEFVYICDGQNPDKNVHLMTRKDYEKEYMK